MCSSDLSAAAAAGRSCTHRLCINIHVKSYLATITEQRRESPRGVLLELELFQPEHLDEQRECSLLPHQVSVAMHAYAIERHGQGGKCPHCSRGRIGPCSVPRCLDKKIEIPSCGLSGAQGISRPAKPSNTTPDLSPGKIREDAKLYSKVKQR